MAWRAEIIHFLARRLRLWVHEQSADVQPTAADVPWLGFVVYPDHRRLKACKMVNTTRRLQARFDAWRAGEISFAEFDASVQGWINRMRYADRWGLRRHVLRRFDLAGRRVHQECRPPASQHHALLTGRGRGRISRHGLTRCDGEQGPFGLNGEGADRRKRRRSGCFRRRAWPRSHAGGGLSGIWHSTHQSANISRTNVSRSSLSTA